MTGVATPVVLLHGFLGEAADFDDLRHHLVGRGDAWIAIDLPGHGAAAAEARSLATTRTGFDAGVDLVWRRIEDRLAGAARCHLVGYSMGGRIALSLAARLPDRVASVSAIGAGTGLADPDERARRRAADDELADRLETEPFAGFLDRWYRQELFAPLRDHPGFPAVLQRRLRGTPAALAAALRIFGPGNQPPLLDALAQRKAPPILLIAGEQDPRYVVHNARVAATCPDVVCRTVPGAGHSAHLERPAELARILADALGPATDQE
jgi:2-succinyl-6-hydroxy-2,4-cyclohexadiene-1-carboxylate synthase